MKHWLNVFFLIAGGYLFLTIFPGFQDSGGSTRLLLKAEELAVVSGKPVHILFKFSGQETLKIEPAYLAGATGGVWVSLKNTNQQQQIGSSKQLEDAEIEFPKISVPGEYELSFTTSSRDLLYFNVQILEANAPQWQRKQGDVVKFRGLYLEKKSALHGKPKLSVPVLQYDQIKLSCADTENAANASGGYYQEAQPFQLGKGVVSLSASSDGFATFELYSKKLKDKMIKQLGVNELAVYLENFVVNVSAPLAEQAVPTYETVGEAVTENAPTIASIQAALESGDQNAINQQLLKTLEELTAKDTIEKLTRIQVDTSHTFRVLPAMKWAAGEGGSCMCAPLVFPEENGEAVAKYWAFMIGSDSIINLIRGSNQPMLFDSEDNMKDLMGKYGKTLATHYLKNGSLGSDPIEKVKNTYVSIDDEWFEYALLTKDESEKFKRNQAYASPAYVIGGQVRTSIGFGHAPVPEEELHICVRNHNKYTPQNIYFRFDIFGVKNEIQQ